ncbi:hypothetical protein M8C21_003976 [Ambrosia artemisiifolia]|uniref:Uncharacterized protein n=1 Tax=Ambrosia artemisiifolia TaxID=4212 RepID=A0AAD5GB20_AMBAR|nr:hypothetical protein M8C21_003976 [Ambrosia artemisiifolia]
MSEARGTHDLGLSLFSEERQNIDIGQQIFCNSAVNMGNIVAVGFDMDYTLVQYKADTFESLAYDGTVKKLVRNLGYPKELLEWSFDWTYMVRGLVLDTKRGNILKMDRHKYVKLAYHGFRLLSKDEKVAAYGKTFIKYAFDGPDYAHIDTFFSLAEAYLYAQLVDFKDSNPEKFSEVKDYSRIYADVRSAVDMCHRDGTLKEMVAKDPKKYINEDNSIIPMLKMLKDSGHAVFLVTNSLWDYTNVVMNFLFGAHTIEGSSSLSLDWLQYFDFVITGRPSGKLINTDNGTPLAQVGGSAIELPDRIPNKHCKVFQGGNVSHLHKLLHVGSSSQAGGRCLLFLNLKERLGFSHPHGRLERNSNCSGMSEIRLRIKPITGSGPLSTYEDMDASEKEKLTAKLELLEGYRSRVRAAHQEAQRSFHQQFHPVWGQLMKAGYQNSRFAHQMERFACLYTSRVGNLGLYSPTKYYRPGENIMAHESNVLSL